MTDGVTLIPLGRLLSLLIPVLIVIAVMLRWSLNARNASYALTRMLGQLLLIGYFLAYIFDSDSAAVVVAVLAVMVFTSSWIALDTVKEHRSTLYRNALIAILLAGSLLLFIVTQWVLDLTPWYSAQYMIPLAGMIFANAMNSVALAAERLLAELERKVQYLEAQTIAFNTAMIPVINSLFAVGLVSLPGMMTGQILSGISPLIAARYQIMVMAMIFASAGIATACFLLLSKSTLSQQETADEK